MTDKQIMDDVDVSGCEHLTEIQGCWLSTCDYLKHKGNITSKVCKYNPNCYFKQLKRKEQEYEELRQYHNKCCKEFENEKQALLEKYNQVSINFYNGDYCNTEHCSLLKTKEQECEELKKEIINKNEKIKELRFSVSDLTNRLCYLNAEKSFRIVDLEQALDEIEKELKEDIYCESQECGCDDFEECLKCTKEHILDIINKAKGEGKCQ